MKRSLLAFLLLAATVAAAPLSAQTGDDDSAVRTAVTALFDAMRAGDAEGVRAAFAPDARLQSAAARPDGEAVLRSEEVERFAAAVGAPRDQVWDERIDAWEVRVDGPLAVATTDYSFYVDDTFSHCGINAIQLLKTADGWKIFQLTDTRRRTGCPGQEPAAP
jgi:ketosteroid isomerase-like protein